MGKKQLEVLKYDKGKARRHFTWLKFLEIFAVFLFIVGFHSLGLFVYNKFPFLYNLLMLDYVSYFYLWVVGFATFVIVLFSLLVIFCSIMLIYEIFKMWFEINWRYAKLHSEDKVSKEERLREQAKIELIKEVEELEDDRKKWGYCVGDEAKYVNKDSDAPNRRRFGQICKILEIDGRGDIYPEWKDGSKGGADDKFVSSSIFKFKQKPLQKKPKLSKLRQDEVDGK